MKKFVISFTFSLVILESWAQAPPPPGGAPGGMYIPGIILGIVMGIVFGVYRYKKKK